MEVTQQLDDLEKRITQLETEAKANTGGRISQQDIIPAAIKQRHLTPSPAQPGDLYYGKDGNSFESLPIGANGQILTVASGVPAWESVILGYAEITSNFTTTTVVSVVDVPGLAITVTIPTGGRSIKITASTQCMRSSQAAGGYVDLLIREDTTILGESSFMQAISDWNTPIICIAILTGANIPSAGSHTYKVSIDQGAAGTLLLGASPRAYILVETI
jgi:hypothetical protein